MTSTQELDREFEAWIDRMIDEKNRLRTMLKLWSERMFTRGFCEICKADLSTGGPHAQNCELNQLLQED